MNHDKVGEQNSSSVSREIWVSQTPKPWQRSRGARSLSFPRVFPYLTAGLYYVDWRHLSSWSGRRGGRPGSTREGVVGLDEMVLRLGLSSHVPGVGPWPPWHSGVEGTLREVRRQDVTRSGPGCRPSGRTWSGPDYRTSRVSVRDLRNHVRRFKLSGSVVSPGVPLGPGGWWSDPSASVRAGSLNRVWTLSSEIVVH